MLKIIYDFDGTLTTSYMPKYSVFNKIGLPNDPDLINEEFKKYAKDNNINIYQAFFEYTFFKMKEKGIPFDDSVICEGADKLSYHPGLAKFFKYFAEDVENYIVTSGYQVYIYHTKFNDYFKAVHGTTVEYIDGEIKIKELISDDAKIKKIDLVADNSFENVIYIGDGPTDGSALKYVSDKGGISILVNSKKKVYNDLVKAGVNCYYFKPDFKESSELFKFIDDLVYFDKCLKFVKFKHNGQKRKQGSPYYTHPLAVAKILRDKGFDIRYQVAGLFHDLLEDTNTTNEEVFEMSDNDILESTVLVTKEKGYDMKEYVNRIMKNDMARMVKLADRLHNVRDSEFASKMWQKKYYKETESWYVTMAKGTVFEENLKVELEKMKERIQK